jgi:hypothetical protein
LTKGLIDKFIYHMAGDSNPEIATHDHGINPDHCAAGVYQGTARISRGQTRISADYFDRTSPPAQWHTAQAGDDTR